jgi:DNA polymerase-3 subunit epsilon
MKVLAQLCRGRRTDGEIGAVKIRNHQAVDEWYSLVNPQRAIPAKITQITGITNEMVLDAPIFAEIADSLMPSMAYGIFVAHNVNFDCGGSGAAGRAGEV